MKDIEFPIFKTKIEGVDKKFNLIDVEGRREYFEAKAGKEISQIKEYLEGNSFIAYLLGKKNAGKGTYSKMFAEIVGSDKVGHISIGDTVRKVSNEIKDESKKEELIEWLKKNYRGYISIEDAIDALIGKSQSKLLPTEFILALIKREISLMGKKALFIDGFPRQLDQISYSLFFRDLINYREDPDFFVLIDIPEKVIDERIKYRRICPDCQTSRSIKLFPTKNVKYDEEDKSFYLMCDNPECGSSKKMIRKEGDEMGIEPIRERLDIDEALLKQAFSLHGIPKILLRNTVPVDVANDYIDDYEITPEYYYEINSETGDIKTSEKPWQVEDDQGIMSYSQLPHSVLVSMIKQLADLLPRK